MEFITQLHKNKPTKSRMTELAYSIAYYLIVVVLLFSGFVKILDPLPILETLKLINIVPENFQIFIVTLLPITEIGLGLLMVLKIKPKLTLTSVTILFAFFLVFSIYGTVVGFGGDCGCFGDVVKSEFGLGMIFRNFFLLIISISLLFRNYKNELFK